MVVGGFNFLSMVGAAASDLGEDGSGFEEIECESDSFLFGLRSLLTAGGGIVRTGTGELRLE